MWQEFCSNPVPTMKLKAKLAAHLLAKVSHNTFGHILINTNPFPVMTQHRHTVKIILRVADHPILSRVLREDNLKVMVFCAGDIHNKQDIAFPHQSEIKVNGGEVKANLRGLKNKPGSTRPVDITKELRLNLPAYNNTVEMTYALTQKVGRGPPQVSCLNPKISLPCLPQFLFPLRATTCLSNANICLRNFTSSSMS